MRMKFVTPDSAADIARLCVGVAGLGLLGYGAWMAYPPAGYIVPGALLFLIAVVGGMRAR